MPPRSIPSSKESKIVDQIKFVSFLCLRIRVLENVSSAVPFTPACQKHRGYFFGNETPIRISTSYPPAPHPPRPSAMEPVPMVAYLPRWPVQLAALHLSWPLCCYFYLRVRTPSCLHTKASNGFTFTAKHSTLASKCFERGAKLPPQVPGSLSRHHCKPPWQRLKPLTPSTRLSNALCQPKERLATARLQEYIFFQCLVRSWWTGIGKDQEEWTIKMNPWFACFGPQLDLILPQWIFIHTLASFNDTMPANNSFTSTMFLRWTSLNGC